MGDTPKRIHVRWGKAYGTRVTYMEDRFWPPDSEAEYVRADLYTALEARVAELESENLVLSDKLTLECALSDGAHRRARTARSEALEEAARVADEIMKREAENTYSYGDVGISSQSAAKTYCAGEIAAAIRALKEKPNGDE